MFCLFLNCTVFQYQVLLLLHLLKYLGRIEVQSNIVTRKDLQVILANHDPTVQLHLAIAQSHPAIVQLRQVIVHPRLADADLSRILNNNCLEVSSFSC